MDKWESILFWLLAAGVAVFAVVKFWPSKPTDLSDSEKNMNTPGEKSGGDGDKKPRPNGTAENAPSESLSNNPHPPSGETNGDMGDEVDLPDLEPGNTATKQEKNPHKRRKKRVKPGSKPKNKIVDPRNKPTTPPRKNPPRIICWEDENRQWVAGVEARAELTRLTVKQNGEPLEREKIPSIGNTEAFVCRRLDAPVEAEWEEDGEMKPCSPRVPCKKGAFAIFSMKNNWQGIGRRVKCMTSGCYVVVAPREWSRIGPPPVDDAPFRDDKHRAHYFKPEHEKHDGFRLPDGSEKPLTSKRGRFELRGEKMSGTHPDGPPLFGATPPTLYDRQKQKWAGAAEIVVDGEHLDVRKSPPEPGDFDLDSFLKEKQGGHFDVWVDDENGDELNSQLDFQFMRGLRQIDIRNVRLLPAPDGHKTAKIVFHGECEIAAKNPRPGVRLSGRAAEVAPRPDNDQTRWEIRDGDAKVEVEILLERIWWAQGLKEQQPEAWVDKLILLKLEDVSVTSEEGLWIKLPRDGFAENVFIGFPGAMRQHSVTARKSAVFAPLKEFALAAQGGREIKIGMESGAETATIARIVVPNGRAEIIRRGGRRDGKGFSPRELSAAGWALARARREKLPVDTRRKTAHNWNIDTLNALGEQQQ